MTAWTAPPRIKIYEALGAIADHRVELTATGAVVTSSSGNKRYSVVYNASRSSIGSNDNGSYWRGYLGYPAIAVLMMHGQLPFDQHVAALLRDIHWKELNESHAGHYDDVESLIRDGIGSFNPTDLRRLDRLISKIDEQLHKSPPQRENAQAKPPEGW
jgi:hypothetical protein